MSKFCKLSAVFMAVVIICCAFAGCGNENPEDVTKISFKEAISYSTLKALDGQYVSISGYLASSSPVDGSFIFLMNLPYQNCPFCIANTSTLSNTLEVYPKKGEKFSYTTSAVTVTGKMVVAENEDEPFTDDYGYEFNFKIVDGEYKIIKDSELTEELKLWQAIAQSDVINDIYDMYDYVNFTINWPTYYVNNYTDDEGNEVKGYFLYASDAEYLLKTDGKQWNYGYKDGYFDDIIETIENIDKNAFADLVQNIKDAQALAEKGIKELDDENYTSEYKYVEKFDNSDFVYTLNNGDALNAEFDDIYSDFLSWIAGWEM